MFKRTCILNPVLLLIFGLSSFSVNGSVTLYNWTSSTDESNSIVNEQGEKEFATPENLITWIFEDGTFIPPDSYREAKLAGLSNRIRLSPTTSAHPLNPMMKKGRKFGVEN
jgi:hypothetical protein